MSKLHVLSAALLLSATFANAQWWNSQDQPLRPSEMEAHSARKVTLTRAHWSIARRESATFLSNEKWPELERMYNEFLVSSARATDGTFMLEAMQGMLGDRYGSMPSEMIKLELESWSANAPQSRLLPIAMAIMWQAQAWAARGSAGASSTPAEAFQIFKERMSVARKFLEESREEAQQSPLWWWASLIVAGSTGMPPAEFDALFEEATRRFPSYQSLYYTRMNYLLPQWGGSFEAVDKFVQRAVEKTSATEGTAMYAWLYLDIAQKTRDRFESTQVSWPTLKKGFEDMIARYPDAWNKNVFATFACRFRDKETTARLLTDLGANAALGAWSPGISTEGCRRFALTRA